MNSITSCHKRRRGVWEEQRVVALDCADVRLGRARTVAVQVYVMPIYFQVRGVRLMRVGGGRQVEVVQFKAC